MPSEVFFLFFFAKTGIGGAAVTLDYSMDPPTIKIPTSLGVASKALRTYE